ncbi:FecR domain-containing protein [Hymenobacter sp. NST-14]|uniref:FecR family protein n=1 Tax=Hymenobacter piscis TaxID=2839984 RepID=UPI001C02CE69|nr:FecR domain-containing protein [Hymenobacter piscis]MBT9392279.1 FecR domain-containing protein [Hymenobacter piscis]
MELSTVHELIGKELAGELTAEEGEVLAAWLAQATPEERSTYEATHHYWSLPVVPLVRPAETATALTALLSRLEADEPAAAEAPSAVPVVRPLYAAPAPWWRSRAAAAVAGLALVGGAAGYGFLAYRQANGQPPLTYEERITPRGATAKVLLADGTAVWLNADTRLWYPTEFSGRREVYLQGEAFFEVAPNPRHAFVVHMGREQVRVLGTSFNVQAYPEEPTVETAVVTGQVAFIRAGNGQPGSHDTLYIAPNQRAVFTKQTASMHRELGRGQDFKAWNNGELVFEETPLDEVARVLARQYAVNVDLDNKQLAQCRLTGRFKNQSLREVVRLLSMTGTFGFELTNERLLLTGPGCFNPIARK